MNTNVDFKNYHPIFRLLLTLQFWPKVNMHSFYSNNQQIKINDKKSLDQLETLKKSLMQKYFG